MSGNWVTTKVAAKALDVDVRTIRKWARDGELPSRKIEGKGGKFSGYRVNIEGRTKEEQDSDARWVKVKEAAEEAGVVQQTMRGWIFQGRVKSTRLNINGRDVVHVDMNSAPARRPVGAGGRMRNPDRVTSQKSWAIEIEVDSFECAQALISSSPWDEGQSIKRLKITRKD